MWNDVGLTQGVSFRLDLSESPKRTLRETEGADGTDKTRGDSRTGSDCLDAVPC
jgi:hypothetical protein